MNNDLKYTFQRIGCYFLALVMAGAIVLSVSLGIASAMLRTESYVQGKLEKYNSQLLEEVNTTIASVAEDTNLPTKAYTESIKSGHIQTVLHQVSGNMVYGYRTDFTESKYLYGYYRTGIINFCKENGIAISEDEIVRNACFAVDAFNEVCGDESTNFIIPFQQTYTKNPLYAIISSVVAFIASTVILGIFTFGKHKKYDYIGLGVTTGGAVLFTLPLFAIIMKYSSLLHFSDVDVYNMGIADVIDGILKVLMIVGIVMFFIGIAILFANYNYYKKKNESIKTEHDINMKLRREFMEDHRATTDAAKREALGNAIMAETLDRMADDDE